MGVYIKGMKMPNNCHECELVDILPTCPCKKMADEDFWNNVSLAVEGHKDCPLVEVPPHGDLIDAFAFRIEMDTKYPFDKVTQSKHGEADAAKSTILMMLAKAPTIIAAEE